MGERVELFSYRLRKGLFLALSLRQPYFEAPDFNYESAKKASGNVAGLCNWADAMCKYHAVAKVRRAGDAGG